MTASNSPPPVIYALCTVLCVISWSCNEEVEGLVHESQIGKWEYISERHGLASNHVNTFFQDSDGKMWVGTTNGITVIDDNDVRSYTVLDGLLDNNVYAINEDREGGIWAAGPRGVNIRDGDTWYYFNFFYGAPVYALLHLKNEAGMLIGTGGYGIYQYRYATPGFSLYSAVDDCQGCNSINAMFQAKDESVWVASFGGARRIRGTFVTQFDERNGLPDNVTTTIAEDSWGNIWIGTFEGKTISRIEGNNVSQVSFNNGADQNFIFGILEDNSGGLWVGTVANGLFHYDGAIMRLVPDGPPDNTITALYKDRDGNIWIGTSEEGIAVYVTNPKSLQ